GKTLGAPRAHLRDEVDRADVGLLAELAKRSREGILSRIESALGHLPRVDLVDLLGASGAPADKNPAFAIEHHGAHARPIGQMLVAAHEGLNARMPARRNRAEFSGRACRERRFGRTPASRSPRPGACR